MTSGDVITIFERLNAEGRAVVDRDGTCAGFAGGLARRRIGPAMTGSRC
ncbi:hypothetical protein X989_6080 [Burkholderia pseudomallei MSHR4378]|nr:hypothetical protein X989_6080 [Burkholderia pseudomallei MSHR4378]